MIRSIVVNRWRIKENRTHKISVWPVVTKQKREQCFHQVHETSWQNLKLNWAKVASLSDWLSQVLDLRHNQPLFLRRVSPSKVWHLANLILDETVAAMRYFAFLTIISAIQLFNFILQISWFDPFFMCKSSDSIISTAVEFSSCFLFIFIINLQI